jgi:hypothetical protein
LKIKQLYKKKIIYLKKASPSNAKWETKTVCEIVLDVLNLEKSVHASLLNLFKCAGGNDTSSFQIDPQVRNRFYLFSSIYNPIELDDINLKKKK